MNTIFISIVHSYYKVIPPWIRDGPCKKTSIEKIVVKEQAKDLAVTLISPFEKIKTDIFVLVP